MTRDYLAYEEITPWPVWIWPIVVGSFLAGTWAVWRETSPTSATAVTSSVAVLVMGPLAMWALVGSLRVRVTHSSLLIGFGRLQWIQKHLPFSEITGIEPVRYSPIREFGGWGVRFGWGGKRAWTIRGNGAVRLTLRDGKQLYVGSDHPQRLAERIRMAGGGRWGAEVRSES
jgi:hypothetical protein